VKILINSRDLLFSRESEAGVPDNLLASVSASIDKVMKIRKEGVLAEIREKGLPENIAEKVFPILKATEPNENIREIMNYLTSAGFKDGEDFQFDPFLARGLDYYTGTVFEADVQGYEAGAVGGGGRYDQLIGSFSGTQTPAVGFSFGFDRTIEALKEKGLILRVQSPVNAVVAPFKDVDLDQAIEIADRLREKGLKVDLYLGPDERIKQKIYAESKDIRYLIIVGQKELKLQTLTVFDRNGNWSPFPLPIDQATNLLVD
jgi:histidyl-tRNA synthetase